MALDNDTDPDTDPDTPPDAPRVLIDATVSLDGFMAGAHISTKHPMGVGGLRLHEWLFNPDQSSEAADMAKEMVATTGAVVLGRRTFDVGIGVWRDTPFPVPCFVLTHRPAQERVERSGTFAFVPDVHTALMCARAVAGERYVRLMGGECSRAFLQAGLVDEVRVQIAPILLGRGHRLFPDGGAPVALQRRSVASTPYATHLTFEVNQ